MTLILKILAVPLGALMIAFSVVNFFMIRHELAIANGIVALMFGILFLVHGFRSRRRVSRGSDLETRGLLKSKRDD